MEPPGELQVEGHRLRLSNLDKLLYPQAAFTKAQVLDYYLRIAPLLLPHLRDRPLTLKRYPDGVEAGYFYEKNCPPHPDWVATTAVHSEQRGGVVRYCLANDLATLVWVANLASLELHPALSHARAPDRPTMVVFDLDPGAPAELGACAEVALLLRRDLETLGLAAFAKVSGSKGMQVYVPINRPATWDDTKSFARALAMRLERERPDLVVSNMKKALRAGRVLVDWSQNDAHKTTICVYSLRARQRPTISLPVTWPEVARAARTGRTEPLVFEPAEALARAARLGDLFEPVLTLRQSLPGAGRAPAQPASRTQSAGGLSVRSRRKDA